MQILLIIFSIFLAKFAYALDCEHAVATVPVNECAQIEQKKVELELNNTYKRIIKKLENPDSESIERFAKTKEGLINAQRAWIKFRETDCNSIYTLQGSGSIRNLEYIGCMQSHAEKRIEDLKKYELELP